MSKIILTTLKERSEYIYEYVRLCKTEWSQYKDQELSNKIKNQVKRIINDDDGIITVVLMLNNQELIGFISLFESDGDYHKELSPWIATFYIKEKYRNQGLSTKLFKGILDKSFELGYDELFFRSYIDNYYDRYFNAQIIDELTNGQKLYKIKK